MGVAPISKSAGDPFAGGFYTVREAARLLNMPNAGVIAAWLKGRGKNGAPVIRRQYAPIGNAQELGFLDLIEIRFIEHFRKLGYSLQSLRKAAETARLELKCEHPFALYGARFVAERKDIFLEVARNENDSKLLNLVTKQYAMYAVLEEVLSRGLSFDPTSGLAERWRPRDKEFPRVVVDPLIAFGQPVIDPGRVPTESIFTTWNAEGGDYSVVADWYELDEALVKEAVEFELSLPN
ncbi:DUF433 domain-containing protein [Rhodoblastus acidophilus]|uniref:DUF433 domain-containing protein n=1 Tax=Rhodoblastus acidophilus TaxID=1074 RepID=A0A6N8DS49_RHOAC|nr:DUF433 domain-containing protein [Rhodoblastus acidophilus]MCW2275430.1 uncharacterized protein (DUF433 family) [Rhodoblastus acidophilus]MTV32013.1 DUF433 domain-containing protein [Rhodoblastus acidophilus]